MNSRNLSLLGALALTLAALPQPVSAAVDRSAVEAALDKLATIDYGDDRAPLNLLDQAASEAASDAGLRAGLEAHLIAVLKGDGTLCGKDYACRALRLVGTEKSVPALADLLAHPQLSGLARFALEPMPYSQVDATLRRALPRLQPRQQIGVLTSLAARRDAGSVEAIAPLARADNARLARAAIIALGKIGTPAAADHLLRLHQQAQANRRTLVAQGLLEVGWSLVEDGNGPAAVKVFDALLKAYPDGFRHEAAFEGIVAAQPKRANRRLLAALEGDNDRLRKVAARLVAERQAPKIPRVFLQALPELPTPGKIELLQAVAAKGDRSARKAVLSQVEADEPAVRLAAIATLGSVGGPVDVHRLGRLAAGDGPEAEAARNSLLNLSADGVDEALVKQAFNADKRPVVRVALIRALADRNARAQADALVPGLKDPNAEVRKAVADALAILGEAGQIPALIEQLAAAPAGGQREALLNTLELICGRVGRAAAPPMLAGAKDALPANRAALLRLLSAVGGDDALAALRSALRDDNPAVRDAAVRALSEWPDATAAADLVGVVKKPDTPAHRALAFRGYVRSVRESSLEAPAKLDHLKTALRLAGNDGEKRLVIGALGDVPTVAALQFVAQQLSNPALVNESGAAAVRIAGALKGRPRAAVAPVIDAVIQRATAKPVRDSARTLKQKLKL